MDRSWPHDGQLTVRDETKQLEALQPAAPPGDPPVVERTDADGALAGLREPSATESDGVGSVALDEPPIRVMALHALLYCERLFYLEEVEEIRVADANVYAGRRLHDDVVAEDDETAERRSFEVASETWGLLGKVDAVRKRDGSWVAYEHKKGRCRRGDDKQPLPWDSDRIQAIAYAVLVEEALGEPVAEARVRYHTDNVTAFVTIDDDAIIDLKTAIERARELRRSDHRPPVTENERLCIKCSLAPVCLPQEERSKGPDSQLRLFPSLRTKQTVHVVSPKSRVSRSGQTLVLITEDEKTKVPIEDIDSVVIHGYGQISTQALQFCAWRGISVQWFSRGGRFVAGTESTTGRVRQRIRQFTALTDETICLRLARATIRCKVESQLRYIMRGTRGQKDRRQKCLVALERMRTSITRINDATSRESLRGLEGQAAKAYFATLPVLLSEQTPDSLHPRGRTKHPPRDRFNCLMSYGYSMLFGLVHRNLLAVGLEPAFGFFHRPRSAAPPLVLDVMELFRTQLWDMPLLASVNRGMWNDSSLFRTGANQFWLNEDGRRQAIRLFEQRLSESYKHPHTGQSLEYARMVELECRLLEKEWSGYPGQYGQVRMR